MAATDDAALAREGDRIGAEYGLGLRTGAWRRTERRFPLGRGKYRLFQFEHGLALAGPGRTALTVLRWEGLAAVRSGFTFAELSDGAGQTVRVHIFSATGEVLAAAGNVLLPVLTARYDAGEPACFGPFAVDPRGLYVRGAESGMWRRISWPEIDHVVIRGPGDSAEVHLADGTVEAARLRGEPNSFLARRMIGHAAGQAGTEVPVAEAGPAGGQDGGPHARRRASPRAPRTEADEDGHSIGAAFGLGTHLYSVKRSLTGVPVWSSHEYEAGAARVDGGRVTVLRLAELASISAAIAQGYDEETGKDAWAGPPVLTDQAGNTLSVRRDGNLHARAELLIFGRQLDPLIARLDAGQPASIGPLSVDRWGIRSQASDPGDRWAIPWQDVSEVATRMRGLQVRVWTRLRGEQGYLSARLDDVPNGFLAGYLLRHAAGQVGVPFRAGE
jgi:hypothetical protein